MNDVPASALRRPDEVTRREFLRLVAATAALAGATGCSMRPPDDPILPYVTSPAASPGVPLHYATAMTIDGDAVGLIVESHDGRPTKIEGNPRHPASLGASSAFHQAALLQLYDPDRAATVRRGRVASSWDAFAAAVAPSEMSRVVGSRGDGLRILLEPTASPIVTAQLTRLRERYPAARIAFYSPLSRQAVYEGTRQAFGRVLQPQLSIDRADVMVSLGADLLADGPMSLRYARQWADGRRLRDGSHAMSRLYVAESALSATGASADVRVSVRPMEMALVADALVATVVGQPQASTLPAPVVRWVEAAAADLKRASGRSIVVAGDRQPAIVHALVASTNARLGNLGATLSYTDPTWLGAGEPAHDLNGLVDELRSGDVRLLAVLGPNLVYTAPDALDVVGAIKRVPHVVYLGPYENETARVAEWMLPEAHFLEGWSDARAYDGTVSIVQPLIAPLHDGRTVAEVLAMIGGDDRRAYQMTRDLWTAMRSDADLWWAHTLRGGIVENTALPTVPVTNQPDLGALRAAVTTRAQPESHLDVVCVPGTVHDGRFANNPWLQELPHPISKLTWGNAAYLNATTASRLEVTTGQVVELKADGRTVQVPICIVPGIAEQTVALPLGYGRTGSERVAAGVGSRAARLLRSADDDVVRGVDVRRLMTIVERRTEPLRVELPFAQEHDSMEGRPIALSATLAEFRRQPAIGNQRGQLPTLYTSPKVGDPSPTQWGMAIDLTVCTGCSACVVACQAENNIAVVGAPGVLEHRQMQWLRIDRYFTDEASAPVVMQPMLCQQCEMAPCEYVCPVEATTHSPDGLNEMVYNRCVGTRFCSNNCPYKVRRFNWFDYNSNLPEVRRMAMNPDVTVRERGVMEKCTFCVQRIREAEIAARVAGRELAANDVITACQQACPTRAIVFGPVNDPNAEVTRLQRERRAYQVLHDLGTRPRVRYLPKITNPSGEEAS